MTRKRGSMGENLKRDEGLGEDQENQLRAKEVMERFEKKRDLSGPIGAGVAIIAISASLYHLFYAYFHPFFALDHRAIHWGFMSSLIFILYPFSKRISPKQRPSLFDLAFWLISAGICIWICINSYDIMNRAGRFLDVDVIIGTTLILLILEAARRSTGWPVPIVAICFLLYALLGPYLPEFLIHKGYSIKRLSTYLALSTDGVFGVPLGVSANFIFLFILYGAILQKSGAGKFFTDLAFSVTGWTRGGPAKAAVVSSCFFGMISGSSVANTVTTGAFTIPLMKKTGYPPHFAGAVEASASTMGQIMPPIMGAAAFLIAEFLGIPYIKVCIAAAIPAVLSFFAIFMQVHFKAIMMGIKGIPRIDLPSFKETLLNGGHHLISIFLLIYFLMLNFSPERAVFWAILATIGCSYIRKHTRMSLREIFEALKEGAIGSVEVAAACAAAGIIIGSITMTGLGLKFSSLIVDLSGGTLLLALPFTMIACLALGMGVPTTAQYIIISALVAPALIKLGVVAIAAHLFIFYFGTRADITPPVALAAYAGAGIAGSNPMKTGVTAFQLGIAGYIVPFMFIYGPELLMTGPVHKVIFATLSATFGVYCLAAGVQNCLFIRTTFYERILLLITSFLLIKPGLVTDLVGLFLFGIVYLSQRMRRKREAVTKEAVSPVQMT
ncbi:MAG: TRAP transporter permease [Thermodesulfobacteriota bacterium]|nr:TRAP transporter permease [Thermodesulfobacteriota bacterium]